MAEKTQLSVTMTMTTTMKDGRFTATLIMSCKNAGEPFADFTYVYSNLPAEQMDMLESMLIKALKRPLPVSLDGLTATQFITMERVLIKLQLKLNDYAWRTRKWSSLQKRTYIRRVLKPSQQKRLEWYTK